MIVAVATELVVVAVFVLVVVVEVPNTTPPPPIVVPVAIWIVPVHVAPMGQHAIFLA